jgi:hypothetical protein
LIKSVLLRVGEKAVINELAKVGVEPFEIMLERVAPTAFALPSVNNQNLRS